MIESIIREIIDIKEILVPLDEFRKVSVLDALVERFDLIFRQEQKCLVDHTPVGYPAIEIEKIWASESERRSVIALVRVNHAGEVSAQGLYLGQAMFSRDQNNFLFLLKAASEERLHLAWCNRRLKELKGNASLFTPIWFLGSFVIGAAVSLNGDPVSLGFVEETEKQVAAHLDGHLARIPHDDNRTRSILQRMREEELVHGEKAESLGGATLPPFASKLMGIAALVMKETAQKF